PDTQNQRYCLHAIKNLLEQARQILKCIRLRYTTKMLSETRAERKSNQSWERLGDFTATTRLLLISALALGIGVLASFVALALLRLIGFFTNLFYYGRWSTALISPASNHLGIFAVLV